MLSEFSGMRFNGKLWVGILLDALCWFDLSLDLNQIQIYSSSIIYLGTIWDFVLWLKGNWVLKDDMNNSYLPKYNKMRWNDEIGVRIEYKWNDWCNSIGSIPIICIRPFISQLPIT